MIDQIISRYEDEEFLKADGFDEAIIGVDESSMRLVYSVSKCIQILERAMPIEDAIEHFEFNVAGSYMGEKTPIWCTDNFDQSHNNPLSDKEILRKILYAFINEDQRKMLITDSFLTKTNNGVTYTLIREDIVLLALRFIANESFRISKNIAIPNLEDADKFIKSLFRE